MSETSPQSKPIRAQFSILTLLLATTIIALTITVATLYREIGSLREEVARLRNEVGELEINDPEKLHIIRVETDNELEWKWRIWIPEGVVYQLRGDGGSIPAQEFPNEGGTFYLRESGEQVIRYRILRYHRDEKWYGSLHAQSGSVGKDLQEWVEWPSRTSTGSGVGTTTQSF